MIEGKGGMSARAAVESNCIFRSDTQRRSDWLEGEAAAAVAVVDVAEPAEFEPGRVADAENITVALVFIDITSKNSREYESRI